MATLGTQNISTSYVQLIKTSGLTGIDGTIQTITDGNNVSSALQLSTAGVNSTGTLNAAGATTLASTLGVTAACTLSSTLGVTGAVTLSSSLGVTGAATFSSSISATTGTVTIGTATISTATISSATIPLQLGAITFGSNITASTGTATIGTESVNTSTIGTLAVSGRTTTGTLRFGSAGPSITQASFGTAAVTVATLGTMTTASSNSTGTIGMSGLLAGDVIVGQTNITTSGGYPLSSFSFLSNDIARYTLFNGSTTLSSITAGTISAISFRTTGTTA